MTGIWSDVRYSARRLAVSPGFTAAAVLTIALGVGLNTGLFSVLNGLLLRDMPVPNPHELVNVIQRTAVDAQREARAPDPMRASMLEYRSYRDRSRTLSGLAAYSNPQPATLGGDAPRIVSARIVTCGFFDVLERQPTLGRSLRAEDCATGADPLVYLSHELWQNEFDADPAIIGRSIELNRQLFSVAGVAPDELSRIEPRKSELFVPVSALPFLDAALAESLNDDRRWLYLVGRRAEDTSNAAVQAELNVIAAALDGAQPGRSTTVNVERASRTVVLPEFLQEALVGVVAVVMSAFSLVLLIACANVANLFLVRASARSRELAVRLSLGASRARVVRQLLAESLLVACLGGVLGSVFALWSFQIVVALGLAAMPTAAAGIPPLAVDASPDLRVFAFAFALTLGSGVVFGLAPALKVSRPDLSSAMKPDNRSGTSLPGRRLQRTLVGAQVAVSMVLMVGAGLLLRGLLAAQTVDPGFAYRDVAFASYDLRRAGYDDAAGASFQSSLFERLEAVPGVERLAGVSALPLNYTEFGGIRIRLPGQIESEASSSGFNLVTAEFFDVVEVPIVRGRAFTQAELDGDVAAVIVTQSTAQTFWGAEDPIGRTLVAGTREHRVVGVARDAQMTSLGATDPYFVYLPVRSDATGVWPLVKFRGEFAPLSQAIRGIARDLDPSLVVHIGPLEENLDFWRGLSGTVASLAVFLGALALVLAAVGIYGVVAFTVSRRLREIGIRMALGAGRRDVLGLILRRTMRPVAIGAAVGIAGAATVSGVLAGILFGVSPLDPVGVGAATVTVLIIALAASVFPALRGLGLEPMTTLREE